MPKSLDIIPYSKKSVFVEEPEDETTREWLIKTVHRLGATKTPSADQPGWILPKDKELTLQGQYYTFQKTQIKARHSKEPNKKKYSSRIKEADLMIMKNQKSNPIKAVPELCDEKSPKHGRKSHISYINWDNRTNSNYEIENNEDDKDDEEKQFHIKSNHSHSESESGSDSESSDDEMIQVVLARKMKNESSGKIIETESVGDSDEEDNVSHSRRFRHIYNVLLKLKNRVAELERKISLNNENSANYEM